MELRDTDVLVRHRPAQPVTPLDRSNGSECKPLPAYIKVVRRTPAPSQMIDPTAESVVRHAR